MKFNEKEITAYSFKQAEKEGRLMYQSPYKNSVYSASGQKERWFKLVGNILFYYRLNEHGGVEKEEPTGLFVLENVIIESEVDGVQALPNCFSIKWKDDPISKHYLFASSQKSQSSWMSFLLRASYGSLKAELMMLRIQIRNSTGNDPLEHMINSFKRLPYMKENQPRSSSAWYMSFDSCEKDICLSSAPSTPAVLPRVPPRTKKRKNDVNWNNQQVGRSKSLLCHVSSVSTENLSSFKSYLSDDLLN